MTEEQKLYGSVEVPLLVNEDEMVALAAAFARGRKGIYTEDEFFVLVSWASDAIFRFKMLQSVLDGRCTINLDDQRRLIFDMPEVTGDNDGNAGELDERSVDGPGTQKAN